MAKSKKLCVDCGELPSVPGFRKCLQCYQESLEALDVLHGKQGSLSDKDIEELRYDTVVFGCLTFLQGMEDSGMMKSVKERFPEAFKRLYKLAADADGHISNVAELLEETGQLITGMTEELFGKDTWTYSPDRPDDPPLFKAAKANARERKEKDARIKKSFEKLKPPKNPEKTRRVRHIIVMPDSPGVH